MDKAKIPNKINTFDKDGFNDLNVNFVKVPKVKQPFLHLKTKPDTKISMNKTKMRNKINIYNNIYNDKIDINLDNLSNVKLASLFSKNNPIFFKQLIKKYKPKNLYSKNTYNNYIQKILLKENTKNNKIINDIFSSIIIYTHVSVSSDAIRLLIHYGADINVVLDELKNTNPKAIQISKMAHLLREDEKIVKLLLFENKFDANLLNKFCENVLTTICSSRHIMYHPHIYELVKLLLCNFNMNCNTRDKNSITNLMNVFYNREPKIIKLLLNYKLDFYAQNKTGKNILNIIEKYQNNRYYKNECSMILNYVKFKNYHLCKGDIDFIYDY